MFISLRFGSAVGAFLEDKERSLRKGDWRLYTKCN